MQIELLEHASHCIWVEQHETIIIIDYLVKEGWSIIVSSADKRGTIILEADLLKLAKDVILF